MKKLLLVIGMVGGILGVLAAMSLPALADHLPARLLASGAPENTLAGINLETGDVDGIVKRLGPPTKTIRVPNNPDWTGYLWQSGTTRLEIGVTHSTTKSYVDSVSIVRVGNGAGNGTGDGSPQLSQTTESTGQGTGQGLKLGDNLAALRRIYGRRFESSKQTHPPAQSAEPFLAVPGETTATLQWRKIEFTLTAGFDVQGKIIALRLLPPECYPGDCK